MTWLDTIIKLRENSKAKPKVTLEVHCYEFSGDYKFIGAEVSITNISTSPLSISPLYFNGRESLLTPYIWERGDGRRNVKTNESEQRRPFRVLTKDSSLSRSDCIRFPFYLSPRETIRGLVFWDWDVTMPKRGEFKTVITATNKTISSGKIELA